MSAFVAPFQKLPAHSSFSKCSSSGLTSTKLLEVNKRFVIINIHQKERTHWNHTHTTTIANTTTETSVWTSRPTSTPLLAEIIWLRNLSWTPYQDSPADTHYFTIPPKRMATLFSSFSLLLLNTYFCWPILVKGSASFFCSRPVLLCGEHTFFSTYFTDATIAFKMPSFSNAFLFKDFFDTFWSLNHSRTLPYYAVSFMNLFVANFARTERAFLWLSSPGVLHRLLESVLHITMESMLSYDIWASTCWRIEFEPYGSVLPVTDP